MHDILTDTLPLPAVSHADKACAPCDLLTGAPFVTEASADLARRLGRGIAIAAGASMDWQVLPTKGVAERQGIGEGSWLRFDTDAGPLYLQDGARFVTCLTGIDGGGDVPWPRWLVGSIAGRLRETPLRSVRAIEPASAPDGAVVLLAWRLQSASHTISVNAAATPETFHALLADAAWQPLRMPWSAWLPLVLGVPITLARHRLPVSLLRTLACGDVILPDHPCFDVGGAGRVTLARRRWRVAFATPFHLQLLNEENPMNIDPTDEQGFAKRAHDVDEQFPDDDGDFLDDDEYVDDDSPPDCHAGAHVEAADDGAAAVSVSGEISVMLRFELGRLRMTLDQLRALGPGTVLELPGATSRSIAITCGASDVGRAEVVNVDGRLGVRITRWTGAC